MDTFAAIDSRNAASTVSTGSAMPVENSRVKGLYKLTVDERRKLVAQAANLSEEHVAALSQHGELDETAADRMIENVIGTMSLPVGVATNFVIDGKHYLIPFCLEESSVVAAASNMAKRCLAHGGFTTQNDDPIMIGQIQLLDIEDINTAEQAILENKEDLMATKPTSMHEAIGEIDAYYAIEKVRKRFKRMFSGLGVDKYLRLFIYRLNSSKLHNIDEMEDKFLRFLERIKRSNESGNTNEKIDIITISRVRSELMIKRALKKKER